MLTILATLPADRRLPGRLDLRDEEGRVLMTCDCRGKADGDWAARKGNAQRDPVRTGGDTPTGSWGPVQIDERAPNEGTTPMGRWVIWLGPPLGGIPLSGQAVEAARNGRHGLAIHAGRGDPESPERLMATHGCLRIRDRDADTLAALIGAAEVRVTIREQAATRGRA